MTNIVGSKLTQTIWFFRVVQVNGTAFALRTQMWVTCSRVSVCWGEPKGNGTSTGTRGSGEESETITFFPLVVCFGSSLLIERLEQAKMWADWSTEICFSVVALRKQYVKCLTSHRLNNCMQPGIDDLARHFIIKIKVRGQILFSADIRIILDKLNILYSTCRKYRQLQTHLSLLSGVVFKIKVSLAALKERERSLGFSVSGQDDPQSRKSIVWFRYGADLSHHELVLCYCVNDVFVRSTAQDWTCSPSDVDFISS